MKKTIGYILIAFAIVLLLFVLYGRSTYRSETRVFSSYTILTSSWEKYKQQFINNDGRVIDYTQNGITTSEGQSYALLRAVWVDDKGTFDKVWQWTNDTMKRPNDHLFGWRWGKQTNNTYGFMPNGGNNSASDADSDIALALILASRRWHQDSYAADAKKILSDIWKIETDSAAGARYLTAGNWASNSQKIVVNPSYFSPYAWRIFATIDTSHDWNQLIDPAYTVLFRSGQDPLDKGKAVGLPPNWISIDKKSGSLTASELSNLTTDYSYDAIRIPWRIALDYQWNKSQKAHDYLQSLHFLSDQFKTQTKLAGAYAHDGTVTQTTESPSMYATAIGYFMTVDSQNAKKIYQNKILNLYSNDTNSFNKDIPYYEQNWLWFGAALYNNALKPLQ